MQPIRGTSTQEQEPSPLGGRPTPETPPPTDPTGGRPTPEGGETQ
jgi:hypothetical protein